MATYLLDTDIIIDALRGKRGRGELLMRLVGEGNALACCAPSVTQVFSDIRPEEQDRAERLARSLEYYDVTRELAEQAGRIRFQWARQGVNVELHNALVAAIALAHSLILVTGNRRHYPMPELRIFPLPDE